MRRRGKAGPLGKPVFDHSPLDAPQVQPVPRWASHWRGDEQISLFDGIVRLKLARHCYGCPGFLGKIKHRGAA